MTADSRRGWQGLVRRTPLWILVLVIATAYAALQLGMRLLRGKEVGTEDVAIYGAFGLAFGIFIVWTGVRTRILPIGRGIVAAQFRVSLYEIRGRQTPEAVVRLARLPSPYVTLRTPECRKPPVSRGFSSR